ncbi:SIR2 family protein [Rufibacter ruber]|uniref:SIR2 family protein n=1 Tax=Rufibacter ruber TaxID=1783499 RepID=UPI00082DA9CC|nr:SIR2 family protein [Rufibacter ruber]
MNTIDLDWGKKHILKTNSYKIFCTDEDLSEEEAFNKRKEIEPWLAAIFQSEHLSLLAGSGLTTAVCALAGLYSQGMGRLDLKTKYAELIKKRAEETALKMERGEANIEDDIRVTNELISGLQIIDPLEANLLKEELDEKLYNFISTVLKTEETYIKQLRNKVENGKYSKSLRSFNVLKTFLLSFSSRAASRERLNIFTTNYDRFIELGCDESGIILLDRFKGKITPIFRNTRLELDFHYNPPGIRGEPRYVEGVVRICKLHGSIDWRYESDRILRCLLPFGANNNHPEVPQYNKTEGQGSELCLSPDSVSDQVVIYPNSSKDIETALYPYSELFRDFSSSICRPNSILVTFGYGFGDSHINRIIEDMLTIPSTHLVIIAWDKKNEEGTFGGARDRIRRFYEKIGNPAQFTLLIGGHFGDISNLVDYYLPKSAIDKITKAKHKIQNDRGEPDNSNKLDNKED